MYGKQCEEINPREKPQNGTQENPEKPNRRRKGESPSRRKAPTKKGCFTRSTYFFPQAWAHFLDPAPIAAKERWDL